MHAITPLPWGPVLAMLGRDRGARCSRAYARQSTDGSHLVTCHIVLRNGLDRQRSQRSFAHRVRLTAQNKHTLMATWAWPPMFSTACTAPTQKSRHTCSLQPGTQGSRRICQVRRSLWCNRLLVGICDLVREHEHTDVTKLEPGQHLCENEKPEDHR